MTPRVLFVGCGDLGLRTAHRLVARGDRVWALRRHPPADAHGAITWLQSDLTRPDTLRELPSDISHVVVSPAPDSRTEAAYRGVFVDGLRSVLAALDTPRLQRLVFISSSAVYGDHHGAWIDEETPTNPVGFNGRILLEAENLLAAQAFSAVALRLAGIYGPGRLQLIERLRAGQLHAPYDPPHWANRIHIDDAAAAVEHLLYLPNAQSVYLGCDDTPLSLHTLYAYLATLVQANAPPDGPGPAAVGSKKLSNARLRASGWRAQWPDAREGYAALLRS